MNERQGFTLRKLPEGGYVVQDHPANPGYAMLLFGCSNIREALDFIRRNLGDENC